MNLELRTHFWPAVVAKKERFEVKEKGMTSEVRRGGRYAISARTSPKVLTALVAYRVRDWIVALHHLYLKAAEVRGRGR